MFSIGVPHFKPFPSEVFAINLDTHAPSVSLFRLPRSSKNRADLEKRSNSSNSMFKKCIFEAVYKGLRFLVVQRCCKLYMYRCIIYFFQPSPLQSMQSVFSYLKVGTAREGGILMRMWRMQLVQVPRVESIE